MEFLSDRERLLLDMLSRTGSVKDAADFIRTTMEEDAKLKTESMTPDAAYSMLYRLRERYVDARTFINTILAYRKRSELLRRVLTPTVKEAREDEEEEEP